jgi:hypothetical protein
MTEVLVGVSRCDPSDITYLQASSDPLIGVVVSAHAERDRLPKSFFLERARIPVLGQSRIKILEHWRRPDSENSSAVLR